MAENSRDEKKLRKGTALLRVETGPKFQAQHTQDPIKPHKIAAIVESTKAYQTGGSGHE